MGKSKTGSPPPIVQPFHSGSSDHQHRFRNSLRDLGGHAHISARSHCSGRSAQAALDVTAQLPAIFNDQFGVTDFSADLPGGMDDQLPRTLRLPSKRPLISARSMSAAPRKEPCSEICIRRESMVASTMPSTTRVSQSVISTPLSLML